MLSYLSKFVLQMLPTISATVIGAYIVSTWINPKTPPERAKITAQAQRDGKAANASAGDAAAAPDEAMARAVEDRSPEDTKPVKAANAADKVRIIPIVKQPAPSATASSGVSATKAEPAIDERMDVNELARAAIARLRSGSAQGRVAEEPAAAHHQPARVAAEAPKPLPAAMVAPPLPPAISVAAPRYLHAEGMDAEDIEPAATGLPDRVTSPPGEIPTAPNPLNLQASHRVAEHPSPAEDFLFATKSLFRAIAPH